MTTKRSESLKQAKEAIVQHSNDKYACLAGEADRILAEKGPARKQTPRVYKDGAEEGTSKVGALKGKDLERLKAQLAGRKFGK